MSAKKRVGYKLAEHTEYKDGSIIDIWIQTNHAQKSSNGGNE